jgi:hypothetical protein
VNSSKRQFIAQEQPYNVRVLPKEFWKRRKNKPKKSVDLYDFEEDEYSEEMREIEYWEDLLSDGV